MVIYSLHLGLILSTCFLVLSLFRFKGKFVAKKFGSCICRMVNAAIRSRLNVKYAQNGTRTPLEWKSWADFASIFIACTKSKADKWNLIQFRCQRVDEFFGKTQQTVCPAYGYFKGLKSVDVIRCVGNTGFSKITSAQCKAKHYLLEYLFARKPGGRSSSMCLRIRPVMGFSEISWLVINKINHKCVLKSLFFAFELLRMRLEFHNYCKQRSSNCLERKNKCLESSRLIL